MVRVSGMARDGSVQRTRAKSLFDETAQWEGLMATLGGTKAAVVARRFAKFQHSDFHKHDTDRSGEIAKWEFVAMWRKAFHVKRKVLSDDDIGAVFDAIDTNLSGEVGAITISASSSLSESYPSQSMLSGWISRPAAPHSYPHSPTPRRRLLRLQITLGEFQRFADSVAAQSGLRDAGRATHHDHDDATELESLFIRRSSAAATKSAVGGGGGGNDAPESVSFASPPRVGSPGGLLDDVTAEHDEVVHEAASLNRQLRALVDAERSAGGLSPRAPPYIDPLEAKRSVLARALARHVRLEDARRDYTFTYRRKLEIDRENARLAREKGFIERHGTCTTSAAGGVHFSQQSELARAFRVKCVVI